VGQNLETSVYHFRSHRPQVNGFLKGF